GYRDAWKVAFPVGGLHGPATDVRYGDFTEESGYALTSELLRSSRPPTALLCANDRIALGAYAALADGGRRVPAAVSVVGLDDTPSARYVRPTLTTLAIPPYELSPVPLRLLPAHPCRRPHPVP